jgi:hypothetical protein
MKGSVHFGISNSDESSQHIARQVVKNAINMAFVQYCNVLEGQAWVSFHSQEELFILPDSFSENFREDRHILPINPNFVLIAESTYKHLDENNLLQAGLINSGFKKYSKKYYVHR